jgi:UPF0716 family protein affecting phage T7 exclusion
MILLIPLFLILEIFLSFSFIDYIGFWPSIFWVFSTFFIGFFMLRFSSLALSHAMRSVDFTSVHKIHTVQQKSTAFMFGALLFMFPGLFTDILGLFCVLYIIYLQITDTIAPQKNNHKQGEEDVIDVEVIDSTDDIDAK